MNQALNELTEFLRDPWNWSSWFWFLMIVTFYTWFLVRAGWDAVKWLARRIISDIERGFDGNNKS